MITRKKKIEKLYNEIGDIAIKYDLNAGEILHALEVSVLAAICHISPKEEAAIMLIDFVRSLNQKFEYMYDNIKIEDGK